MSLTLSEDENALISEADEASQLIELQQKLHEIPSTVEVEPKAEVEAVPVKPKLSSMWWVAVGGLACLAVLATLLFGGSGDEPKTSGVAMATESATPPITTTSTTSPTDTALQMMTAGEFQSIEAWYSISDLTVTDSSFTVDDYKRFTGICDIIRTESFSLSALTMYNLPNNITVARDYFISSSSTHDFNESSVSGSRYPTVSSAVVPLAASYNATCTDYGLSIADPKGETLLFSSLLPDRHQFFLLNPDDWSYIHTTDGTLTIDDDTIPCFVEEWYYTPSPVDSILYDYDKYLSQPENSQKEGAYQMFFDMETEELYAIKSLNEDFVCQISFTSD